MATANLRFKQTPNERYSSDMSKDVENIITECGVTIEGYGGGTSFDGYGPDEMCSEEDLDLRGSKSNIYKAAQLIRFQYKRPVVVEFNTVYKRFKNRVWWKLFDWGFVK